MTVKCRKYDSFVTHIFYPPRQKKSAQIVFKVIAGSFDTLIVWPLLCSNSMYRTRMRRYSVTLTFLCKKSIFYPKFRCPEWANIKAENARVA